jgi:hypothetical protein
MSMTTSNFHFADKNNHVEHRLSSIIPNPSFKRLPSELVGLFPWLFPLITAPSPMESCDAMRVWDRYMSATTTSPVSHVELLSGETSHTDWRVAYRSSGATAGLTYRSTVYGWAFLICPWLPLHECLCVVL